MNVKQDRLMWELRVVSILLVVSLLLYVIHFAWFRDLNHILLWSFTSLAFLPISVLVVTLLINRLLSARDKAMRLDKLNMLIGIFYSSVGNELLLRFSDLDAGNQYLRNHFGSPELWSKFQEKTILAILAKHNFLVSVDRGQLVLLKKYLDTKMDFLMRLIENPILLEHENFTNLLRTVFHLAEELAYRGDIDSTPDSDVRHLTGDIERVYTLLTREWALYMIFLRQNFPYLLSLSIRINPFDRSLSVAVVEKDRSPYKQEANNS
jgi:hypothetical protein